MTAIEAVSISCVGRSWNCCADSSLQDCHSPWKWTTAHCTTIELSIKIEAMENLAQLVWLLRASSNETVRKSHTHILNNKSVLIRISVKAIELHVPGHASWKKQQITLKWGKRRLTLRSKSSTERLRYHRPWRERQMYTITKINKASRSWLGLNYGESSAFIRTNFRYKQHRKRWPVRVRFFPLALHFTVFTHVK